MGTTKLTTTKSDFDEALKLKSVNHRNVTWIGLFEFFHNSRLIR